MQVRAGRGEIESRGGTVRAQARKARAQDISTPAGSRSCKDGDPTRQVQGGGGQNSGENSQVCIYDERSFHCPDLCQIWIFTRFGARDAEALWWVSTRSCPPDSNF